MAAPRPRLFYRLLLAYVLVVCACAVFIGLPLHLTLRHDYIGGSAARFQEDVRRLEPGIAEALRRHDRYALDLVCRLLRDRLGGHVIMTGESGNRLGDSGPLPADGGRDVSRAVALRTRLDFEGVQSVILRLELPLVPMASRMRQLHLLLLAGTAGAGLLAVLVGFILTRHIARPLAHMTEVAEKIAGGDFDSPVRIGGSDEIGRLGSAVDTMRCRLRDHVANLAREHDRVLAIIRNMSEGVVAVDAEGAIRLSNAAAQALLQPTFELRRGLRLHAVGLDQEILDCVGRVAETGGSAAIEIGDPLAGERVLAIAAGPIAGHEAEEGRGVVMVIHDVTESRRVEAMGRELVANASHELRTPLTTIASTIETLLEGPAAVDREVREFLEIIARHAERLRLLVDGTLQLSRLDAAAGRLHRESIDLAELVESAVEAHAPEAERKGQQVTLELAADLPLLEGDGQLLVQAVGNLIGNAVRYTPEGGRITVRARVAEGEAILEVADTGPGISPDEQTQIFDRFFRGRSAEGERQGAGLGLSIVRRVAAAHGGRLELESDLGRGSTFRLSIPLVSSRY